MTYSDTSIHLYIFCLYSYLSVNVSKHNNFGKHIDKGLNFEYIICYLYLLGTFEIETYFFQQLL